MKLMAMLNIGMYQDNKYKYICTCMHIEDVLEHGQTTFIIDVSIEAENVGFFHEMSKNTR